MPAAAAAGEVPAAAPRGLRPTLRRLWRFALVLACVLYALLLAPLAFARPDPGPIAQHWFRLFARVIGLRIRVQGQPQAAPRLLVGNHISFFDIIVVCASVPVIFVSKDDVRRWPVVGLLTRAAKTLFIARGGHATEALRAAILGRLRAGHRVVIFPEGTTSTGESLRRFQPRLFAVAIDGAVQVQPFALHYRQASVAYVEGSPSLLAVLWACLGQAHTPVHLHFGPQLPALEQRKAYAQAAQDWVATELAAMHARWPRGPGGPL